MLRPPNHVATIRLDLHSGRDLILRTSHSQHVPIDQVLTKGLSFVRAGLGKPVPVLKEPLVATTAGINVDDSDAGYDASGNAD
jgi:hypothetical protein